MNPHIAVVDDEPRMAEVLAMLLRRHDYEVSVFNDPNRLVEALAETVFDLVLTDLKMPGIDGAEVLRQVKAATPETPVIVLTAHGTVSSALAAIRQGAFDYVEKPIDNDACVTLVGRALELTRLERHNRYLRSELRSRYALDDIVVASEAMDEVLDLARRAARSRATVLIGGESGTGKELVARAIHYHSERVGEPFVAVNCGAFAPGVLESELFGHEQGAFTGAAAQKQGIFERADGGTLFLDELGEVDSTFQVRLLRVLQQREVRRVGGGEPVEVDVRVVAATNRDLEAEVEAGRFREDLYYRLAVIPIRIPPLRERRADILALARHFLVRAGSQSDQPVSGWTDEVEAYLVSHDWPGNVRELENTIERAVVLARHETIELDDLMLDAQKAAALSGAPTTLEEVTDRAADRHIRAMLARTDGARQEAAELLGVDRSTLYRLMKKYTID